MALSGVEDDHKKRYQILVDVAGFARIRFSSLHQKALTIFQLLTLQRPAGFYPYYR
jgi:hypothetical protein